MTAPQHGTHHEPCALHLLIIIIGKIRNGKLGDLAPTILKMVGHPLPAEMNGSILLDI